jgi:hypothetical protein
MSTTTSSPITTQLNAIVTPNTRIKSDDRNFILLGRHLVDPTKSPAYKAPADGSSPPPPSEEWRTVGWFSRNSAGLSALVTAAVLRDTDVSQARTLADALKLYAAATTELTDAIKGALAANADALDKR